MLNLHYINVLKEIIVTSYGWLRLVLMKCWWIPINNYANTIMKQNEYEFWVVNHRWRISTRVEPYIFPSTISQVNPCCYYKNPVNHEQSNTYHMNFWHKKVNCVITIITRSKLNFGFLVNIKVNKVGMGFNTIRSGNLITNTKRDVE